MADIIESNPTDLNVESPVVKEKTIDEEVLQTTEKGDGDNTESVTTKDTTAEVTEDTESTGTKRKSDDLVDENEETGGKKVKSDDKEEQEQGEEVNGISLATPHHGKQPVDVESEGNGKARDHQEEVLKKSEEDEIVNPAATTEEDVQA